MHAGARDRPIRDRNESRNEQQPATELRRSSRLAHSSETEALKTSEGSLSRIATRKHSRLAHANLLLRKRRGHPPRTKRSHGNTAKLNSQLHNSGENTAVVVLPLTREERPLLTRYTLQLSSGGQARIISSLVGTITGIRRQGMSQR